MNAPEHRPAPIQIPVDRIYVVDGFNPRRRFPQEDHDNLVRSIRTDGVITAIAVRSADDDGRYPLIAGERRFRASRDAGLGTIPALVFDVDDATAKRMALAENAIRRDLTPAEEAFSAQAHLDAYDGDHAAAAAALGWSPTKLKHRIQLMRADQSVLDALMNDEITIGHAELLAALPLDRQTKALPRILSEAITVAQLKEQLQGFSIPLSGAIFDLSRGCIGCPHNSTTQGELFSEHIGGARCTNRTCYAEKTQEAVEEKRQSLKDDFVSVALVTEKPQGGTVPLVEDGPKGVGPAQFAVCRGCAFRGAIVEDRIGPTVGHVTSPVCFNTTCHAEKVAAWKTEREAPPPAPPVQDARADAGPSAATQPANEASSAATAARQSDNGPKKTVVALSSQVIAQHRAIVRRAITQSVRTNPNVVLSLAAYAVGLLHRSAGNSVEQAMSNAGLSSSSNAAKCVAANVGLERAQLQAGLVRLVETFFTVNSDHVPGINDNVKRDQVMARLVKELGLDLTPHVVVDHDFLNAHTKDAIELILDESGFKKWLGATDEGKKKLKAILGGNKKSLIEGVLAAGFDFTGYRPSTLVASLKALSK